MANYQECVLCDSKVSEVCGKWYVARDKRPPCAKVVVENCHSTQQLKAEIRSILAKYESDVVLRSAPKSEGWFFNRLRELSAV